MKENIEKKKPDEWKKGLWLKFRIVEKLGIEGEK